MGKLYKHEEKKKTKAKVLNDNLIITSANKTVNFLMSQIYYEMLWNIQVPLTWKAIFDNH